MTNDELKSRIGANIARLRKASGMTQAELAQRLNYSDKAISKWERSESMPDVLTLIQLAELFSTDVNALLADPNQSAEPVVAIPSKQEEVPAARPAKPVADKGVIQKLCSILVWVIALFLYVLTDSFGVEKSWMVFLPALLANAIVLLSLRSAWHMYSWNKALISIIMWDSLAFIFLIIYFTWQVSVWRLFLMGLLGQAAIILWFRMFRTPASKEEDHE